MFSLSLLVSHLLSTYLTFAVRSHDLAHQGTWVHRRLIREKASQAAKVFIGMAFQDGYWRHIQGWEGMSTMN